ncbi:hypothetical protein BH23GEM11_BH23GEM11_00870 [soil metagenome]
MEGESDAAHCPSCGLVVDRRSSGAACLRVHWAWGAPPSEVPAAHLADRLEAMGGALPRATAPDGSLAYEAGVCALTAGPAQAIRYRGLLLGFAERFTPGVPGRLRLHDEALILVPTGKGGAATPPRPDHPAEADIASRRWPLESLRSLQTSSSAVQITTLDEGIVLFRFDDDSPRRWDELLRIAISRRWELLGKGTVREFQPRIRAEAFSHE